MDTVTAADGDARYRQLFNAIDQGFCVIEMIFDDQMSPIDYRFIEVNDAFAAQTGLVDATSRTMRAHAPAHEQHWFDIYGEIALTRQSKRFEVPCPASPSGSRLRQPPLDMITRSMPFHLTRRACGGSAFCLTTSRPENSLSGCKRR
ncbi:PAS/PAC sensor hybrid histidine kinase (plasmid) [Ketogulonicigenium vulgare Y25]|uniref:PAS domain-containing protein n=1 Tax=Ketogulonicigenium vulgare TaxID=92945 RepID=UPI0001E67F43|nr:PAS domain-containing protein [Ketogulonicigenium vulgare]ADO44041.1 PAS/PAC sensor hybrid histidine kinase [Ketogulonicigenium vulgare Y25]